MCYSKEVTFAAGTLMVIGSAYAWHTFIRNNKNATLKPVFKNIVFGYLCIALHQFGDSLSVATGSAILYKLGLIASISCMYFYMCSLEALSGLVFGSSAFAALIALCALNIAFTPMFFENQGFWVRGDQGNAYFIWSSLWLALFIYWNICVLYFRKINSSSINKRLLIDYGMYSINLSFILYTLYAYISLFIKAAFLNSLVDAWNIFTSFDVVKDSPSIWCVFSVVQAWLIPSLFKRMDESYESQAKIDRSFINWKTTSGLLVISFFVWLVFLMTFPMLFGAAMKMIG